MPFRRLVIGVGAGLALLLVAALGLLVLAGANMEKLRAYNDTRESLQAAQASASEVLDEAGSLEPEMLTELEGLLGSIEPLLNEDRPGLISFGIDKHTSSLAEGLRHLDEPTLVMTEAIGHRGDYEAQLGEAQDELTTAKEVLEESAGEVLETDLYDELFERVEELEEALETAPDESSGESFATQASALAAAVKDVPATREAVSESHEEWVQAEEERLEAERQAEEERKEEERLAEEEAAKSDPANYDTLTEREWALIERDPDSYEGEKYRLYGHVTQADAATGSISIRVNTGAVQQSRRFDYNVNTFVIAGSDDVFEDIVQGDHVKMLVEVAGSFTYDTTIGGSATAVFVAAYDVEVIGHF